MQKIIEALQSVIADAKRQAPFGAKILKIELPPRFTVDGIEVSFTNETRTLGFFYEMDINATREISETE